MASQLNDDMIFEILLRLPAKAITKFKPVSRDWLSLISSDQFRRLHTLRHLKPPPSLLLRPRHTSELFYLNLQTRKIIPYRFKNITNPKIVSSCNGLMILQSDRDEEKDYYVYNPTTHQSRRIIEADSHDDYSEIAGLNLVFDPSKSLHYKIVCVRRKPSSDQCQIEVYDSESHAWTQNSEPFAAPANADFFAASVYCDGKVCWKLFHSNSLYYDVDRNAVGDLPAVVIPRRSYAECLFQEFNGRLHQFTTVGPTIAIYELKEDLTRWSLKYECEFRKEFYNFGMMSLAVGDDGAARMLVDHGAGKITAYRFSDKSCEELADCSDQTFYKEKCPSQFEGHHDHQFLESLAPV